LLSAIYGVFFVFLFYEFRFHSKGSYFVSYELIIKYTKNENREGLRFFQI
jgi:hypothetical protein